MVANQQYCLDESKISRTILNMRCRKDMRRFMKIPFDLLLISASRFIRNFGASDIILVSRYAPCRLIKCLIYYQDCKTITEKPDCLFSRIFKTNEVSTMSFKYRKSAIQGKLIIYFLVNSLINNLVNNRKNREMTGNLQKH